MIMEGFLIVMLSIPFVDKSLQMDLYKVYNLPVLHPELKVQFSCVLEGEYLAISCPTHTLPCLPPMKFVYVLNHKVTSVFSILPYPQWTRQNGVYVHFLSGIET